MIDEALLTTLPERERRQGEAERIKTELLAGPHARRTRRGRVQGGALPARPARPRAVRQWLNLGHTFAHALEAAADFDLPHGEAVALGLLAALRLSGRDTKRRWSTRSTRSRSRVDRERAWQALLRDKKRSGDEINLVLLGDDGPYVEARPADEVRAALDSSDRLADAGARPQRRNLDALARRDPAVYGGVSLNELESRIYGWAHTLDISARCRQTNSEGEYIDWIHDAYDNGGRR